MKYENNTTGISMRDEFDAWIRCYANLPKVRNYTIATITDSISSTTEPITKTTPRITNYKYDENNNTTIICWSDGTKTYSTKNDPLDERYIGFVTAVAKKFISNVITQADNWIIKKPAKEAKLKAKQEAELAEQKRINAKKAAKKAKWELRRKAIAIAEEYKKQQELEEIKKLAVEKYNVPVEFLNSYKER